MAALSVMLHRVTGFPRATGFLESWGKRCRLETLLRGTISWKSSQLLLPLLVQSGFHFQAHFL